MELIESSMDKLGIFFKKRFPRSTQWSCDKRYHWRSWICIGIHPRLLYFFFFFIGIMEESGYLSRVSFIMDKFMGKFGLSGKSFIPYFLLLHAPCPAIMSTRTIENKSDKMATILISPLITCSARYPVYILVIGAIFPQTRFVWNLLTTGVSFIWIVYFRNGYCTSIFALIFKENIFSS